MITFPRSRAAVQDGAARRAPRRDRAPHALAPARRPALPAVQKIHPGPGVGADAALFPPTTPPRTTRASASTPRTSRQRSTRTNEGLTTIRIEAVRHVISNSDVDEAIRNKDDIAERPRAGWSTPGASSSTRSASRRRASCRAASSSSAGPVPRQPAAREGGAPDVVARAARERTHHAPARGDTRDEGRRRQRPRHRRRCRHPPGEGAWRGPRHDAPGMPRKTAHCHRRGVAKGHLWYSPIRGGIIHT